jgi:hypothetical protein
MAGWGPSDNADAGFTSPQQPRQAMDLSKLTTKQRLRLNGAKL